MPAKSKIKPEIVLVQHWELPAAVTLGSSVRARGVLLEIRAKLAWPLKRTLDIRGNELVLGLPAGEEEAFANVAAIVADTLVGAPDLPVIPREIEDILAMKSSERHRWLKDGRLRSAGTRTIKLRGRARQITFHVFDPRYVEELLDNDQIVTWREDDIETAARNRELARERAAVARLYKAATKSKPAPKTELDEGPRPELRGWEEFERLGLLR